MRFINDYFGIYEMKEYRLVTKDNKLYLVSKDPDDKHKGFLPYEKDSNFFVKIISDNELKYAYHKWTIVIYKGKEFGVINGNDTHFTLMIENQEEAKQYNFTMLEPALYVKKIPIPELEEIIYRKRVLPGYHLPSEEA
jgi:hypothetical protein